MFGSIQGHLAKYYRSLAFYAWTLKILWGVGDIAQLVEAPGSNPSTAKKGKILWESGKVLTKGKGWSNGEM